MSRDKPFVLTNHVALPFENHTTRLEFATYAELLAKVRELPSPDSAEACEELGHEYNPAYEEVQPRDLYSLTHQLKRDLMDVKQPAKSTEENEPEVEISQIGSCVEIRGFQPSLSVELRQRMADDFNAEVFVRIGSGGRSSLILEPWETLYKSFTPNRLQVNANTVAGWLKGWSNYRECPEFVENFGRKGHQYYDPETMEEVSTWP